MQQHFILPGEAICAAPCDCNNVVAMSDAKKQVGPDELVTIARFQDLTEAELAAGRLESAGIECVLQDEHMSSMVPFGLYTLGGAMLGGVRLQVCQRDEADAAELLADEGTGG